ncbi:hypothetical protein ACFQZI_14160 [Mucilaginibacter lutimaris]|uniref:Uncharacterized protein n=1 Tax=Mucilaginibacter lutimaris TaxID=931629 RepID=A0ABW2ZIK2_9SPHI
MNKIFSPKANGFIFPNIFALTVIGITRYIFEKYFYSPGLLIFSEFIIVPFVMGIISAWFWRDFDPKNAKLAAWAFYNTVFVCILSTVFLGEGMICLVIVSPLLFTFIWTGELAGKRMFEKNNQTLNVSVFVMLFGIFVVDSLSVHHYENMVADTVVINAPPSEVWKYVVAYKASREKVITGCSE